MKKINGLILSALTAAFLVGCGGGGGSSSSGPTTSTGTPTTLTGTFIDAPVKGLHYKTATQEGDTNENGEFKYIAGETIEFKLGNLSLGSVNADGLITPYTLAGDTDISNPSNKAIKIAMLLQNFDVDNDGSILDVAKLKDEDLAKDFNLNKEDELLSTFQTSIENKFADFINKSFIPAGTMVIGPDAATKKMKDYVTKHYSEVSIVKGKTIILNDSEGNVTLNFYANGTYSESGFDTDTKSNYTCSGKWLDFGNNKIAATCEKDGTSNLPTESDTTFQFTTLTDGTKVTVKGDVDTTPFEATIVSSKNVLASSTTTPSTTSIISGKQLVLNDGQSNVTLNFNSNGTYSESGFDTDTNSDYTCSGLWLDLGNSKIAATCENGGTSKVPTESDTTFQFTTLENGTTVTVKGDVDTTPFDATIVSSSNL